MRLAEKKNGGEAGLVDIKYEVFRESDELRIGASPVMKFKLIQNYFYVGRIDPDLIIFGIMESCHQMRGVILS